MKVVIFKDKIGKEPFSEWVNSLSKSLKYRIYQRFSRIEENNFGDHRSLRSKLYELRFHFDSGLRVYYTKTNDKIVILLNGGNKKSQKKDINKAREYLKEFTEEKNNEL